MGDTSTRVLGPAAPTATQVVGEVQETLLSPPPPAGSVVAASRHNVPFHVIAIGAVGLSLGFVAELPTAVHAAAAVQETPTSSSVTAVAGSGSGCRLHAVPFQRSASPSGCEGLQKPADVHALALVQESELSELKFWPPGLTGFWAVHAWPHSGNILPG